MDTTTIDLLVAAAKPDRIESRRSRIEIYLCPECGAECRKRSGLHGHLQFKHPNITIKTEV